MFMIDILDPFLLRQFLKEEHSNLAPNKQNTFQFTNQNDFTEQTMSYMINFSLNYTFDSLVREGICEEEQKNSVFSFLSEPKLEEVMETIHFKIKKNLYEQITPYQFDFISFFLSEIVEERKQLKNLFYEAVHLLFSSPQSTIDLLPNPSEEIVYFIVLQNGGIQLKDKYSDEIDYFTYNQQEEAVAKTCHLNPESLIIYDNLQLLDPEMVICFKKLLGRKVNFVDSPFPEY